MTLNSNMPVRADYLDRSEMFICVLKTFRRQMKTMRRAGISAFAILILAAWLLPPIYETTAIISLTNFSNPLGNSQLTKEISLPDQTINDEAFADRIEELNSARFQLEVRESLGFSEDIDFDVVGSSDRRLLHKLLFPLLSNVYQIEIKRPKLTKLIKVSVRGSDPKIAHELTDQFIDSLISNSVARNLEPSRRSFDWLLKAIQDDQPASEEGLIVWDPKINNSINSIGSVALDPEIRRLNNERMEIDQKLRAARLVYFDQHPLIKKLDRARIGIEDRIQIRLREVVGLLVEVLNGKYKITNIGVVQSAALADRPIFPNRIRLSLESLLLSFALAFLAGLSAQLGDRRVISAEDLPFELRASAISRNAVTLDDIAHSLIARGFLEGSRPILIIDPAIGTSALEQTSLRISQRIASLGHQVILIDADAALPLPGSEDGVMTLSWDDWVRAKSIAAREGGLTRILPPQTREAITWLDTRTISALKALPSIARVIVRLPHLSANELTVASSVLGKPLIIVPQGSPNNSPNIKNCSEALFHKHAQILVAILARS